MTATHAPDPAAAPGSTLDPRGLPLAGLHLIEASAGTGKTYAIAHLVLRLVLAGRRIDQVLVLTFTEAATEELRSRIARRLREARALLDTAPPADVDPLLLATLAGLDDPAAARLRLDAALTSLDRAAIRTIHGFCGRVLKDFAFESGAPFDAELITDERELRLAAAQDFWRRRMAAADAAEAAWLLERWPAGPASLLAVLGHYLGHAPARVLPEPPGEGARLRLELTALHASLAAAWPAARDAVTASLRDDPSLNRRTYSDAAVEEAIAAMDAWCYGAAEPAPETAWNRLQLFTPEKLKTATKKAGTTPVHPFFDRCAGLTAVDPAALDRARRAEVLTAAHAALGADLARLKEERRVLYYDDLLKRTAAALDGPLGPALALRVRTAHPIALIDEFQDTDDLQYRIFAAVYGGTVAGPGPSGTGLYLIGDPKQAIYGFRGADIFTYIAARRNAQGHGQVHTLDTNRRSASPLVAAVNRFFGRVQRPFVFEPDIRFAPVAAGPDADARPLLLDGAPGAGLVFRWIALTDANATDNGKRIVAEAARTAAVGDCAAQIADLLGAAAAGRALVGERPLAAGDIAVLVRKHGDGLLVREALGALGIGSVSVGRETVYQSEEAEDLAALLAALAPGARDGAVRTALATRLLGWTAAELAALAAGPSGGPAADAGAESAAAQAEARWGRVLARFEGYREAWRRHGFMAALESLIHAEGVAERLRRGPDGERRLTNLLHLAELAQAASREHPGHEGLARWLADRRGPAGGDEGDAALLRLESDEHLVQIVTYHKSKGLEYPVVFLPLPWSSVRAPAKTDPAAFHDRRDLSACLDLGSPAHADHCLLRDEEDLAERLRLLYVAVTRARHRCVVHWGAVNQAEGTAAAYLLHQGADGTPAARRMKDLDAGALRAELAALAADPALSVPGAVRVEDVAPEAPAAVPPPAGEAPRLAAAVFDGRVADDWRLWSFSALAQGRDAERPDYDQSVLPAELEPEIQPEPEAGEGASAGPLPAESAPACEPAVPADGPGGPDADPAAGPSAGLAAGWAGDPAAAGAADGSAAPAGAPDPVFRFPRGARAGHCLHDLLEHLDFRTAAGPDLGRIAASALLRHGLEPHWAPTLETLVGRVLDTSLDDAGLRLRGLPPADRRNELEFHFALDAFDPADLDRVLAAHGLPTLGRGGAGDGRATVRLAGLMKGFVDLVIRVDGRFYILDYKSNYLGDAFDDYGPAALERAMRGHGYHLQYLIYTVALHRYLRRRLPGYDYDSAVGGVRYLFLRGMRPETGHTRGVYAARPTRGLIEDLDLVFSGGRPARPGPL